MPLRPDAWIRPDYDYPVEAYLADLDAHGIAFGVIAAASLYGDYNDYTLEALRAHKRLRATVMVDPGIEPAVLREMRDLGVVGVRLQWKPDVAAPDMDGFDHAKLLNRLADLGMHVELNCSGPQLSAVLPKLVAHGIDVVVDHLGMLRTPGGIDDPAFADLLTGIASGRVWVKLSAGFRLAPELFTACVARLLAEAGPERMMWGSDAPFVGMEDRVTYTRTVTAFEACVPDRHVRRRMSDTALRFYLF